MKRALGLILAVPLLFAVGCAEEEAAPTIRSQAADYGLGTYVILEGKTVATTRNYVDLDGTVTQVDDLHPQANTLATGGEVTCRVLDDGQKTEVSSTTSEISKVRIAGRQTAWILPGAYSGAAPDPGVNVWGDPANGNLFLTEPDMDILIAEQAAAECNCDLDQYLQLIEVALFIFEEDVDAVEVVTTTTVAANGGETTDETVTTIDDTTAGANQRTLNTFGRFQLDGYVWQTNNLNNLYTGAPAAYNASLIIPNDVEVGDVWLDNNGNLVAAVGTETLNIGGKSVSTLIVVERGSTDVDMSADGVAGWCVNYFQTDDSQYTIAQDTVQWDSELTDYCNSRVGSTIGTRGVNGVGSGWVNQRKTWYYKGLPVKIEETTVDIHLDQWGYAIPNDGNLPAGIDAGFAVGDCARYHEAGPVTRPAAIDLYKPYALFTVENSTESWQATELRTDFTIAREYAENN